MIDACFHAGQMMTMIASQMPDLDYDDREMTPRKLRYSMYRDVAFEETLFNPTRGLEVRISFLCPKALRGRRLGVSKQLEDGMLVALVGLNSEGGLSTTFMEIQQRQSTDSMRPRTGNDHRGIPTLNLVR